MKFKKLDKGVGKTLINYNKNLYKNYLLLLNEILKI